jgi:uncharacterized membrane protein
MSRHVSSPARLEAFSDGVIAVIITIMVLELKVPHQDGVAGLRAVLPTLCLYLISFAFTGIYWINHHQLVHRTEEADELILYANLGFLFCLSLLPFFTSYVLEKKMDSFSVAVYISSMVVTGFSFLLLRLAISRRLRHTGRFEAEDKAVERKNWLSLFVYLVAIPLAFQHPHIALGLVAFVTIIWITPTVGIKPREEYPRNERG